MNATRPLPLPLVRLYAKAGCHLCEQAEAELARLRRRYPHALQMIDITVDTELLQCYGERIPVVVIADQEYAAPLQPSELERALASAARTAAATPRDAEPSARSSETGPHVSRSEPGPPGSQSEPDPDDSQSERGPLASRLESNEHASASASDEHANHSGSDQRAS
jgi:hypothetical protein